MKKGATIIMVVICGLLLSTAGMAQSGKGPDTRVEVDPSGPAPANDDCANAIQVTMQGLVSGTTVGASIDDTVAGFCGTGVTSPGVWYRFTALQNGNITVSMCQGGGGASYDSKLSIYTGSCAALNCVGGNDDTCGLQSEVSFAATSGTEYFMLVHGFGGASGTFDVDVSGAMLGTPAPPAQVPVNSPWALILLVLALGAVAVVVIRR